MLAARMVVKKEVQMVPSMAGQSVVLTVEAMVVE